MAERPGRRPRRRPHTNGVVGLVVAALLLGLVPVLALPADPVRADPVRTTPVRATQVPDAAAGELPLPDYNPTAVANPPATVSAGTTKMGGTKGAFSVSPTGAAQYEVPLWVVPGRGGYQPRLALTYRSDAGNGHVGVGFSLSGLSTIARCPKTILDDGIAHGVRLDGGDPFCLNGQRLVPINGANGGHNTEYRTKPDSNTRVRSYRQAGTPDTVVGPTHFMVWTPDGQIQEYGVNGTTVKVRHLTGYANLAWAISRARDRSDNVIAYEYGQASDLEGSETERWLQAITYGHGATLDRRVELTYDPRPDPQVGYAHGAPRLNTRRLTSLTMSAYAGGWKRARSYALLYENSGPTKASKLRRLTECGTVATECKQYSAFSWWYGSGGFKPRETQSSPSGQSLVPSSDQSQIIAADFSGDGRTDLAWPEGQSPPGTEAQVWKHLNANADGTYTTVHNGEFNGYNRAATAYPVDYDLNGMVDLMPREAQLNVYRPVLSRPNNVHVRAETTFMGGFNQVWNSSQHAGAMLGDFDGDGYEDVLEYRDPLGTPEVDFTWGWRRRTGELNPAIDKPGPFSDPQNRPFDDKAYGPQQPLSLTLSPDRVLVADVNGDGRDEMLMLPAGGTTTLAWDLASGSLQVVSGLSPSIMDTDVKLLDVNGDGLPDILKESETQSGRLAYQLNTGRGFTTTTTTNASITFKPGALKAAEVIDYDGDGRQDLLLPRLQTGTDLFVGMDVIRADLSATSGPTFVKTATVVDFSARDLDALIKQGPRIVDADGDGLSDVLLVDRPASGAAALQLWRHNGGVAFDIDYGRKPDLLYQVFEGSQVPQGPIGDWPTVRISYAPLTDPAVYTRGACPRTAHISCVAGGMYVVKQVRTDAGLNDNPDAHLLSDYVYRTGRVHKKARTFLGFTERLVYTKASTPGHGLVLGRTFYSNTVPGRDPRPVEEWGGHTLPDGQLALERTNLTWSERPTDPGNSFPFIVLAERREYELAVNCVVQCLAFWTPQDFDGLGKPPYRRVTRSVGDMDVYGNAGSVVTETTGNHWSRHTVTTSYANDAAEWLVRRPTMVVTKDARDNTANAQLRTTEYSYPPGTDRVSQEKSYAIQGNPVQTLTVDYAYDGEGNVVRRTAIDAQTGQIRESTAAYDPYGYPHATIDGLAGHVSRTGYDPVTGWLQVVVDVNGLREDRTYDSLGRLVQRRSPSGAVTSYGYALELRGEEYLVRTETADGTGALSQVVVDRLGRPVVERFTGFDHVMRERESRYEAEGRLLSRTIHRRAGSTGTPEQIGYGYDDRGRTIRRQDPGGGHHSWSYQGLVTTYTDPNGHRTQVTVDAQGQPILAVEALGTAAEVRRSYAYGPFGVLVGSQIEGVGGSLSTFTYDALGNALSSTDAERGTTTNTYNAFGDLVTSRDALGRETRLTYDPLGRVTERSVDQNGSPRSRIQNIYDTLGGTTRKGKLLRTAMLDAGEWTFVGYGYDALSRLTTVDHTLPVEHDPNDQDLEETFRVGFSYDVHGRITGVRYPKLPGQTVGTRVSYEYTNARLARVRVAEPVAEAATVWTALATDGQDRLVHHETGDGVTNTRTLNWRGASLVQRVTTSAADATPSRLLLSEEYGYDVAGNLTVRRRAQPNQEERFSYDALDRLTAVQLTYPNPEADPEPCDPGPCDRAASDPGPMISYQADTWAYDKLGNITASKRRGDYVHDPARPTQVTEVTGGIFGDRRYGYDAVGNQISRPDGQITYTDVNLPARITASNGRVSSFLYYPTGERARKTSGSGVTTSVPGLYERHHTPTGTEHRLLVSAAGTTVAILGYAENTAGTGTVKLPTRYVHADRLGSTSLVTVDEATTGHKGVVLEDRSYDAFGKPRAPDWRAGDAGYTAGIQPAVVDRGFTGHNDDREFDLVDMRGRIFDPTLGRFLTPDPFVDGPHATQAWNRYTYVGNNPLRHTDPTGFLWCTGCPENVEAFASASGAFWSGGAWGISPVNPSSPDGGGRFDRELDKYYNNETQRQYEQWKEKHSTPNGTQESGPGNGNAADIPGQGGGTVCTAGPQGAPGTADEMTCVGPKAPDEPQPWVSVKLPEEPERKFPPDWNQGAPMEPDPSDPHVAPEPERKMPPLIPRPRGPRQPTGPYREPGKREPDPEPKSSSDSDRIQSTLREVGVPVWALGGTAVLVAVALADPEPLSKSVAVLGAATAIAVFALLPGEEGRGTGPPGS